MPGPTQAQQGINQASAQGTELNGILPSLADFKYLKLIDTRLGYHNLELDEQSLYLTTFSCWFGRSRYVQLPFGQAPTGDMFDRKIGELFQGLLNVFDIANNILIAGLDDLGRDHDTTLDNVLRICRKANLS